MAAGTIGSVHPFLPVLLKPRLIFREVILLLKEQTAVQVLAAVIEVLQAFILQVVTSELLVVPGVRGLGQGYLLKAETSTLPEVRSLLLAKAAVQVLAAATMERE